MPKNVGHVCNVDDDKWCQEGANPARHPDHDTHKGGCICLLGDGLFICSVCGHSQEKHRPDGHWNFCEVSVLNDYVGKVDYCGCEFFEPEPDYSSERKEHLENPKLHILFKVSATPDGFVKNFPLTPDGFVGY